MRHDVRHRGPAVLLETLLQYGHEALSGDELRLSAPVVVLERNIDTGIEDEQAWSAVPVVGLAVDEDEPSVDVLTGGPDDEPLSIGIFLDEAANLGEALASYEIYCSTYRYVSDTRRLRIDSPAIAVLSDATSFGVVKMYDGWEEDLASLM
jgi:hypothetical protein